ncbi:unnamed protein product [Leuciscus chuanchicus]
MGQEGDNEEWPQWSYESRRLLGMRKGAGSEGYDSQQEQSVPAVLRDRAAHHVTPLRCSSAMEPDS